MSKKKGMKWPICSVIILSVLFGLGYVTFNKYKSVPPEVIVEREISPSTSSLKNNYRSSLSKEFIFIFGIIMLVIMSTIIYLWWALKDWEGGKKYGEENIEDTSNEISEKT